MKRIRTFKPFARKISQKIGLPPGTLIYTGEKKAEKVRLEVIDFTESDFIERELKDVDECYTYKDTPTVSWINVNGIHNVAILERIGKQFGIHPLVLEDILNVDQRPKMEDFGDYIFFVLKMISFDREKKDIKIEQMSLVLTPNCVITFQEFEGDIFDQMRSRLRNGKGRIRRMGADYLAYSIFDAIIDEYFLVLEELGENIEEIEAELITNPIPSTLQKIHHLKREMLFLRRSVWPLREMVTKIERAESVLIHNEIIPYLRDLYDHTIQIIDTIESLRDMVSGMLDIYLSSVSNKMNEVMKVLTIIATIFIPLSFFAGLFGMNFRYMPELDLHWTYPLVLLGMLLIGVGMLFYFRRKKWL